MFLKKQQTRIRCYCLCSSRLPNTKCKNIFKKNSKNAKFFRAASSSCLCFLKGKKKSNKNAKFNENKNDQRNHTKNLWYKSLVKNAKITENKNDQCNHATNLPLKMRKSTKTKTINGIMLQIFRKKRESQQKQK